MRSRFNEELAYGEEYQRAYQQYEAEKIAAGMLSEPEGAPLVGALNGRPQGPPLRHSGTLT